MTRPPAPAEVADMLEREIAGGGVGSGAQASWWINGHPAHSIAVGLQSPCEPMSPATLHNLWCATKPIAITSGLRRLWELGIHDAPLREILGPAVVNGFDDGLSDLSVPAILSHAGGLERPTALAAMLA